MSFLFYPRSRRVDRPRRRPLSLSLSPLSLPLPHRRSRRPRGHATRAFPSHVPGPRRRRFLLGSRRRRFCPWLASPPSSSPFAASPELSNETASRSSSKMVFFLLSRPDLQRPCSICQAKDRAELQSSRWRCGVPGGTGRVAVLGRGAG
jgi:hypothetical protein